MEKTEMIIKLNRLARMDIDAYHTYAMVREKIEHKAIQNQLKEYMDDHRHHIEELSAMISTNGGTPPYFSEDFSGLHTEGFTSVEGMEDPESLLEALKDNEAMTNTKYKEISSLSFFPLDISEKLVLFFQNEQKHIVFLKKILEERTWELSETV